jgi:RNA polymerase sigma-70 factor (ECF subfamily)
MNRGTNAPSRSGPTPARSDEIATIVSRSPDAARQLASRARRHVQGSRPPDTDLASQRHVLR